MDRIKRNHLFNSLKFTVAILFGFSLISSISFGEEVVVDPHRFDAAIEAFETADRESMPKKGKVLFLGSSSIRRWDTASAFPGIDSINRGFGGSQISDSIFFFDRIVALYAPSVIVFYAGDNDVYAGKSRDQVFGDFKRFAGLVKRKLKGTRVVYIPIKPSISRASLWRDMAEVNRKIKNYCKWRRNFYYADIATPMLATGIPPSPDLFVEDGLHLSDKGNALWANAIRPVLDRSLRDD